MTKIKIISNPYTREISYYTFNETTENWDNIKETNPNSRLREEESERAFLPFKVREIIDIIISDYESGREPVDLIFEGTQDEYDEVKSICQEEEICRKLNLSRSPVYLENARFIRKDVRDTFEAVHPIIEKIVRDDTAVIRNLNKVSDALKDVIPICVFGNYSSGKSTFINALIGGEILPSGGDPVTAKIYKISKSDQNDCARIRFTYLSQAIDLFFENDSYRILKGDANCDLLKDVYAALESSGTDALSVHVNAALNIINGFEKRDKTSTVLGNIIELEVPFSRKDGILGQSDNKFVIFDTPGSNSASNIDHGAVLAEALEGFSNGIPVWVSSYESIDTTDNAELCDKVLEIKALDKRFTMIVLNKADGSDLPEDGFTPKQIQEILEYTSVEKMYSAGIFFVSSIMGLGAKNSGKLTDKHYRKIFRSQEEMYSDPEDIDYATLYNYNIMPDQIKSKVIGYSQNCNNLIYANSGLLCIEMEMENFASKHSAYNKCQMVYLFLNEVVGETNKRIAAKTERLERTKAVRVKELDGAKRELIDSIERMEAQAEYEFEKKSKGYVKTYVDENIHYEHSLEEVEKIDIDLRTKKSEEKHLADKEQAFENYKTNLWTRFKTNGQSLFKGNFLESFKNMADDLSHDIRELQEARRTIETSGRELDQETADRLINITIREYKKNMLASKDTLSTALRAYWRDRANELRTQLVELIAGSDALSGHQREELSEIIINYRPLEFNDDAENIFIKKKFLRGNVFGFNIGNSERINTRHLLNSYNDKIQRNTYSMAFDMNTNCFESFKSWEQSLYAVLEANITEYNPALREMADMIRDDTERILELADNQRAISAALDAINDLMSWKKESNQ